MWSWLAVALLVAIGSALFPPLSCELFVLTLAARHPQYPALLIGTVIGVGQVLGKLLYYYAGRGSVRLPTFLHPRTKRPARTAPRLLDWARRGWQWLREKCHAHPGWMVAATASSALVGVPPFMATSVLAGVAGLSPLSFVLACFPGRLVRFSLLAAAPKMAMTHHHLHNLHWHFH